MMSPLTLTRICSMISPRIGATDAASNIAAAKSFFFIIFNILAYLDAFAQVAQEARNPVENAPCRAGVLLGRPEDLVPGEPGCDFSGRRPGSPPRRRRPFLPDRRGQDDPHIQLQRRRWTQLDGFSRLDD